MPARAKNWGHVRSKMTGRCFLTPLPPRRLPPPPQTAQRRRSGPPDLIYPSAETHDRRETASLSRRFRGAAGSLSWQIKRRPHASCTLSADSFPRTSTDDAGQGVPNVRRLEGLRQGRIRSSAAAGTPQTASNAHLFSHLIFVRNAPEITSCSPLPEVREPKRHKG